MNDIDPAELSRQLKKPTGKLGRDIAKELNESNLRLYELAWEMVDFANVENVLEIGFGNGKYLSRYFDFNPDISVTGVDFSKQMCKEAGAFHPKLIEEGKLSIHCADSLSIPVKDHSFDLVIGLNIVYFWDPLGPHIEEIRRILKRNGKLLLGYRPRKLIEHMEFTKQNFILYDPEELNSLISERDLAVIDEQINSYKKKAPDGLPIEITDICLVAERRESPLKN